MTHKYVYCPGFFPINHIEEAKDIHEEAFNNIPHCIKNHLHVNVIQDGFVMYNGRVLMFKQNVIPKIPDYMIPEYCCQNNQYVINLTSDNIISNFEAFKNNKLNTLYLSESMRM